MLDRLVRVKRRLDHLDDPGLVADPPAAAILGRLVKLMKLPVAPLRLDVPRGEDRDHDLSTLELVDDLVVVHVAARELSVSPNPGRLAK